MPKETPKRNLDRPTTPTLLLKKFWKNLPFRTFQGKLLKKRVSADCSETTEEFWKITVTHISVDTPKETIISWMLGYYS